MAKTKSYLGNPLLVRANVPRSWTQNEIEEYIKCSKDVLYFVEHYVKIIHVDRGLIPFIPYARQKELLQKFTDNRFNIVMAGRQSGKTTTAMGFLLWYILFNQDKRVAILANKHTTAKEILGRLQKAYQYLPEFLKQGIKSFNKSSFALENGSEVISAATSSNTIRGFSFSLIYIDETAHIEKNVWDEFYTSTYPTISSGIDTKVILVSTPKGLNHFYKIWKEAENKTNYYITTKILWHEVPGRDLKWAEQEKKNLGSDTRFNQEHMCEFIGSVETLIPSGLLTNLPIEIPISTTQDGLRVYEKPQKDRQYVITVDTSRAKGEDYSTFIVFDVTEIPYRIVCVFKNNTISPLVYPNIIAKVGELYNEAYTLIELNDLGQQVADILFNDLEYTNMFFVTTSGRRGQILDEGFSNKGTVHHGIITSKSTKSRGCSNLKELIENSQIIIRDYDIIDELSTFVYKRGTYQADTGKNDDLAMCLVLFGWIVGQEYYKELFNKDIRTQLYDKQIEALEQDHLPIGFFDNGINNNDDGTVPYDF